MLDPYLARSSPRSNEGVAASRKQLNSVDRRNAIIQLFDDSKILNTRKGRAREATKNFAPILPASPDEHSPLHSGAESVQARSDARAMLDSAN
jgi:hypothetical protein